MSPLTENQKQQLEHINRCQEQGQSISAYAKAHGLKAQTLYQWRSLLRKKGHLSKTHRASPSSWIPVIPATRPHGRCLLRLPNGMELEWDPTVGMEWLWPLMDRVMKR